VLYQTIARNFLIFIHIIIIVPVLVVFFGGSLSWTMLLAVVALFSVALNSMWIGMIIGPLSARFRDLPQILASFVQLAFFLTPVRYPPAQLQGRLWFVTDLNPFASFIEIMRAPLLGYVPAGHHYLIVALSTAIGWGVALPFYARFRGRVVYWL